MNSSPGTERVLRGTLSEVHWGFLVPPDLDQAAQRLSRRVRRQLREEARTVATPEGYRSRIEQIGVRRRERIERPWFGLGLAVRCTLEAAGKLRLQLEPDGDSATSQPPGGSRSRSSRRRS
ncbi:MAG: hypothetical protein R2991_00735 [Thermoanaerobaculia bacterium]